MTASKSGASSVRAFLYLPIQPFNLSLYVPDGLSKIFQAYFLVISGMEVDLYIKKIFTESSCLLRGKG